MNRLAELALLLGIPALLAGALLLAARRRQRAASALGDPELVRLLWGGGVALPRRRIALLLAAALALGAALVAARHPVPTAAGDADVVLALDVSNSMRVADVEPDRLGAERAFAAALLGELQGVRVGLVAFAGRGYVLSPLTEDAASLGMYLEALDPEIATQGGSSLASALRQGVFLLLAADSTRGRSLVVVSDGDALEDEEEVIAAAELARRNDIVVHTIGVGTAAGGPIPDMAPISGAHLGFKREPDGAIAISALDADLLRRVASITGGSYRELRSPRDAAATAAAALAAGRGRGGGWPLRLLPLLLALGLLGTDAVLGLGPRAPCTGRRDAEV
ncbi:MAG: VWA domain-containing protein [Longimicrobiaceae bacterium]